MNKILMLFIAPLILTSCGTFEALTIANGHVYTDADAYIAYDVYNELYENGVYEYKPLIIKSNK